MSEEVRNHHFRFKKAAKIPNWCEGAKKTTILKCILFGKLFIILGYIHTFKVLSKE